MTHFPRWGAALALLISLSACQSESSYDTQDMAMEASMVAEEDYEARSDGAAAGVVQPTSQIDVPAPSERLLLRTASLRIRAEDHAEAVVRSRALVDALGGFVGNESSQRYADRVETTLSLRVPSPQFDTLLAALSSIDGEVDSRTVSVDDVTRQVADIEARLGAKRAAEAQYLELMGRSGSIEDVLAVQLRLQQVREEIESAEAQLRAVRDQVSLSTINLTVYEASAAGITSGPGFFAQAWRAVANGWDGLLELLLGLLTIWPLFLFGAGVVWLLRRWRSRRRQRIYGAPPKTE